MLAISASTSTPTAQSVQGSARLAQARREADQAEATAKNLRAQADAADRDAAKSQSRVQNLARTVATDPTYKAKPTSDSSGVSQETQNLLVSLYTATSQKRLDTASALKANANAAPVVNTQGQATGRIVNVTA